MSELEERWRDVGEFIREQRRIGELSLRRLSELAGVSNPYLSQIERGLRKPSAEILRQIAQALHISAETLYVRAGILDDHFDHVDPVSEIKRDPSLGEDQKRALIHIYESFRAEFAARTPALSRDEAVALLETIVSDPAIGNGSRNGSTNGSTGSEIEAGASGDEGDGEPAGPPIEGATGPAPDPDPDPDSDSGPGPGHDADAGPAGDAAGPEDQPEPGVPAL